MASAQRRESGASVGATTSGATLLQDDEDGKSGKGEGESLWLHAFYDPVAGLKVSSSQCVLLADLGAKQDSNLIVADSSRRLKVWQGLQLFADLKLLDAPTAICSFYPDAVTPRIPSIAVAAGAFIYIYRNLKPYYKFTMPVREVHIKEETIWRRFIKDEIDGDTLVRELYRLRDDEGVRVSYTTTDVLGMRNREKRQQALSRLKEVPRPYQMHSVATCLISIKKTVEGDDYAQSVLIVGCEGGTVLIMDGSGTAIQRSIDVPSTPVMMTVSGVLEVEYRITFTGRNGKIYSIKNGELAKTVIEPEALPCDLVRLPQTVWVGCMNNIVSSYQLNGRKNFSIYLPSQIAGMEAMWRSSSRHAIVIVALQNGEIRLYNGKTLINTYNLNARVSALRFGRFGREDAVLVAITDHGDLHIKILPRKASLDVPVSQSAALPEQDVPLRVPQKTKLYVEQTQREREQAVEMHCAFQRDLCKLRLHTARAYMKVLNDGQAPMAMVGSTSGTSASLTLNASVFGLGPLFKLNLCVQNTGSRPVYRVQILFQWDTDMYNPSKSQIPVPIILPGPTYNFEVPIRCLQPSVASGTFNVCVCSPESCQPMLSAVVKMPLSELDVDE